VVYCGCVFSLTYPTCNAHAPYFHLWPARPYNIFPHYLTNSTIFPIVWPCIVADSLWIKPTYALNFSYTGITTLHVSGSLSAHHQEFLAIHRLWYILCSSILLLVANGSLQLHKMYQSRCMAKNSWWWAERLPETCRVVIPTKLEFSASVCFIQREARFSWECCWT